MFQSIFTKFVDIGFPIDYHIKLYTSKTTRQFIIALGHSQLYKLSLSNKKWKNLSSHFRIKGLGTFDFKRQIYRQKLITPTIYSPLKTTSIMVFKRYFFLFQQNFSLGASQIMFYDLELNKLTLVKKNQTNSVKNSTNN